MIRRLLPMCAGFVALSSPLMAMDIVADGKLRAATVYADRAALSRQALVDVPAGKHVVVFKGLSVGLLPDSLRAEGVGNAPVVLGALSQKIIYETELVNEKEKALNASLKELEQKKLAIYAKQKVLDVQRRFFEALQAQTIQSVKEEISVYEFNTEKWVEASKVVQAGLWEESSMRLGLNQQLQDIDAQMQKIRNELNQVRTGQKRYYEVRIPVEAKEGARLNLALNYQIPGASWRPVYDARLDIASGALELSQYGSVSQRTGEDWSDIELTLSTARPHRGAQVPQLDTMWVNLAQNYLEKQNSYGGGLSSAPAAVRSRVVGVMSLEDAEMDMMVPMEESVASAPVAAQIDTGGFTAEYIIPGPSSVLSDGSERKVYIGKFDTDNKMQIHIKPQVSNDAFLVANATLQGETPILPGQVSLFRDGAFVGQTQIGLLRPGKGYDLSFGIDDQIEVKRKVLKDERSKAGMFVGKSEVVERHYVTEIANLRGHAVDVVVDESVPVAQDKKIQAQLLQAYTSTGYELDADNVKGLMRWSFTMEPKAERDLKLGWSVAWPQDQSLTGL